MKTRLGDTITIVKVICPNGTYTEHVTLEVRDIAREDVLETTVYNQCDSQSL